MFEQLFSRMIGSTEDVGATSGSANFQESSVNIGDTIHADFTWTDASYHLVGECYATMYIYNPSGSLIVSYIEESSYTGSKTLSRRTNVVGVWMAVLKVWNGSTWLEYVDTVNVIGVATSGSANFQETSAVVGDTIHADFFWANAHKIGDIYVAMWIFDPDNMVKAYYYELVNATGNNTLEYDTDKTGTWRAKIEVWDGSTWLEYPDTISVTGEGKADIVAVDAPSTFTPGVAFYIYAEILNVGSIANYLFVKLTNVDTGDVLYEATSDTPIMLNEKWIQAMEVVLTQTTDFHGRVDAGHITGQPGVSIDIYVSRR